MCHHWISQVSISIKIITALHLDSSSRQVLRLPPNAVHPTLSRSKTFMTIWWWTFLKITKGGMKKLIWKGLGWQKGGSCWNRGIHWFLWIYFWKVCIVCLIYQTIVNKHHKYHYSIFLLNCIISLKICHIFVCGEGCEKGYDWVV